MSTATEATVSMPITTNNETYRVYGKTDADGKIQTKETRFVTAGKENKTWNDLDADTSYTLAFEQSVREYKVGSWDAAASLIPDEDERVNIFNAGLIAKTDRKVKAKLTEISNDEKEFTFEPVELFDTLELIQEATQRKNLTPLEKAGRQFKTAIKLMFPTLSDEEIEAKVSELLSSAQAE